MNAFSGYLQSLQSQGERALILLPSDLNYLTSFFSCLFSQTIAVPLYDINEEKQIPVLKHIIKNCDALYIITEQKYVQSLTEWLGDDADELVFCTVDSFTPKPYTDPEEIPDDSIAYLQYTSGSTSSAKGVKITYDNIFATCRNMQNHFVLSENDVYVTWLPLYFDMGLIGANVNPFLTGASG